MARERTRLTLCRLMPAGQVPCTVCHEVAFSWEASCLTSLHAFVPVFERHTHLDLEAAANRVHSESAAWPEQQSSVKRVWRAEG